MSGFDITRYQNTETIQNVIHNSKTVAVVGLSANILRASFFVGFYLKRHGYTVIPVNPREPLILGETSYPSLKDVPVPDRYRQRLPRSGSSSRYRGGSRGSESEDSLVPVHCDQRGRRAYRRGRRGFGDHGPLYQSRARALCRPNALARVQHEPDHIGSRRLAVMWLLMALQLATTPGIYDLTLEREKGAPTLYSLSIPEGFDPDEPRPLVIALHFAGKNRAHFGRGILTSLVEPGLRELGAIIAAPDSPGQGWTSPDSERAVLALVDFLTESYRIDPKRMGVTLILTPIIANCVSARHCRES